MGNGRKRWFCVEARTVTVALEMGVTRRMIEYRKKNAEQKIADFAQKYGLVSRDV